MKLVSAVFAIVLAACLTIALSISIGPLPPLGAFLNPLGGFWTNAELSPQEFDKEVLANGVLESVHVMYDKRGVPHIFAKNTHDLYFAQGYVTAIDRLWQMEFGARAAAGRLSEVLGERTIAYDRYQRNIGMTWAAENTVEEIKKDSLTLLVMQAYTDGINAYIQSLRSRDLPVEYKLLNYKPEEWSLLKTALVAKNMSYTLTGYSSELPTSLSKTLLAREDFELLFPNYTPYQDPTVPDTTKFTASQPIPEPPATEFSAKIASHSPQFQPDKANGSNNWVVGGAKTLSGFPILADDMHLSNTLPAIWYEIQLHAPGVNVYGVSIPGTPAVIVGFNADIAWGFTNVGADVMDWYEITFQDSTRQAYLFESQWIPVTKRVEAIRVKGGTDVIDTLRFTHHGPVAFNPGDKPMKDHIPAGHALRWTAHDKGNIVQAFLKLNRAKNYDDYTEALKDLTNPAQNVAYADREGNIALWVNGKFPIRWKGQGKTISDGSSKTYDWAGFIPHEEKPHYKNPARGWVSSANQFPVNPEAYPYYLGWDFAPYERGARINQRLAELVEITPNDMRMLQMDAKSLHAQRLLPHMLDAIVMDSLNEVEAEAYLALKGWDFVNRAEEMAPAIFFEWFKRFEDATWNDEFPSDKRYEKPERPTTVMLAIEQPDSKFFDDKSTPESENFTVLARRSFSQAVKKLEAENGKPGTEWRWGKVKAAKIPHLAMIPGFGMDFIETSGGSESVNATRGQHGPSWRMVVDLSPNGKAQGIFPGGQSGNPGSKTYDDNIKEWAAGHLHTLYRLNSPDELADIVKYNLMLKAN